MAVDIIARGMAGSLAETVAQMSVGYKAGGSIKFSELPNPSSANLNYMYNIEDDFTTDSRFIEGSGKHFEAGTNVAIIEKNGSYYFDIYGTFIDLTNYVQKSELPEALASKQDKTDNNLQTTDKTIVGAINELKNIGADPFIQIISKGSTPTSELKVGGLVFENLYEQEVSE